MRRTKIVCTLGPASSSPGVIESMVRAGMNVARLNFSHGTHQDHARAIEAIREVSEKLKEPVAILQDLQGPRIRTGTLKGGSALLKKGQRFVLTTRKLEGDNRIVSTTYDGLARDVKPGDHILLDDGMIQLEVKQTDGVDVICEVIDGGTLGNHKGINLPGVEISVPALTEKDKEDLRFGVEQGVDYVALSFVRRAEDVIQLKEEIRRRGGDIPVIAKLEKPEAIERLEEILEVSDGVMVARGDLGVEMRPEKVPIVQKEIIHQGMQRGIPVITATQMLESMRYHPRPTRAEASDVANAIFDGTDAVMLSGETATGSYPVETVEMMARIIQEAEASLHLSEYPVERRFHEGLPFPDAISNAACHVARQLRAKAIVAFTQTGFTARLISKYRPQTPIIAFTPHETVRRRLCLLWGVTPKLMGIIENTDEMIRRVEEALLTGGLARKGDAIVILSGAPIGVKGTTNLMKLHRVGEQI